MPLVIKLVCNISTRCFYVSITVVILLLYTIISSTKPRPKFSSSHLLISARTCICVRKFRIPSLALCFQHISSHLSNAFTPTYLAQFTHHHFDSTSYTLHPPSTYRLISHDFLQKFGICRNVYLQILENTYRTSWTKFSPTCVLLVAHKYSFTYLALFDPYQLSSLSRTVGPIPTQQLISHCSTHTNSAAYLALFVSYQLSNISRTVRSILPHQHISHCSPDATSPTDLAAFIPSVLPLLVHITVFFSLVASPRFTRCSSKRKSESLHGNVGGTLLLCR